MVVSLLLFITALLAVSAPILSGVISSTMPLCALGIPVLGLLLFFTIARLGQLDNQRNEIDCSQKQQPQLTGLNSYTNRKARNRHVYMA